jgi:thymidylate synthase (FAD)
MKEMMNVALLQQTPDPEKTIALAARLCYSPSGIDELRQKMSPSDIGAFLEKIMSLGHESVLEHASFTFGIEGISRAASHQLVRHRLASYSQQSQRYVKHDAVFEYIVPDSIAERPELAERFEARMRELHEEYRSLLDAGVPAEDARFLLPNAVATKIIVTMNARELLHFFRLRCCERAQWEIRKLAVEMLKLVKGAAPVIFREAGPECVFHQCPEGKLTCGNIVEVRKKFQIM